ncbi:MAG: hypothetical protein PHC68_16525 [Syntrophorhabdaceae bacterium]|jgi:hypothetical protein|nr:hypothetical protein [Syntrophorhabdaceae bacterium]
MEWLWAVGGAIGSALVTWGILAAKQHTRNFIVLKVDPWMEKKIGDESASKIQKGLAEGFRNIADALDEAAETDSFPGK